MFSPSVAQVGDLSLRPALFFFFKPLPLRLPERKLSRACGKREVAFTAGVKSIFINSAFEVASGEVGADKADSSSGGGFGGGSSGEERNETPQPRV